MAVSILRFLSGGTPAAEAGRPVPFATNRQRLCQLCAVWPDGRCIIARGYERDPELRMALTRLKGKGRIPQRLREEIVTIDDVHAAWNRGRRPAAVNDDLRRKVSAIFHEAATARASDVVFENDGHQCTVWAIVNDSKLALGHPRLAQEGQQMMGYLFHAKDEGSSQTSYQRGEFQGFSVRAGGEVPLPEAVSALRCQRGPHDPDGDHLFARMFYRDQLDGEKTLEDLGFRAEEAAVFAEIRMSLHGGIFIGGSTGDGKSTTLAVNLALQMAEHRSELNLVTLEDPVEYRIPGALQIAVPTSGTGDDRAIHFRKALMHFCRVHPASGMVSEIRDSDAATQVLQFVDTGHQVWTTIHVDTANAILFRLLDMGVDPSAVAKPGNVALLMKQTLLPMLCEHCAHTSPATADIPDWLTRYVARLPRARYRNRDGCAACQRPDANAIARKAWTGYVRQQVVAEIILPDSGYLRHVADRDPIRAYAWWIEEMGGIPIGRKIWELVARGQVDPLDALTKGARAADIPATDPDIRLVEGASS